MATNLLLINSKDRASHSTSSTDFEIELKYPIEGMYQIQSCVIPNTFYNITSLNNVIYFNDGGSKSATLDPGIYDISDLTAAIKSKMDAASTITFTVTLGSTSHKLNINGDSAFTLEFGTQTSNSAASILGYPANDTSSATDQEATNVIDLSVPKSVIIDIEDSYSFETTSGSTGSLYIPLEVNGSDVNIWKSSNAFNLFVKLQRSSKINVKLRDSQKNPLSLNGADWEIMLQKCN